MDLNYQQIKRPFILLIIMKAYAQLIYKIIKLDF